MGESVHDNGSHDPLRAATPTDAAAGEPTVRLENVSKRYGEKQAVDALSLNLHRGEVFAFLGPNGAGKTTTLKMTVGLLRSDTGHVVVCGHDMQREPRLAKQHVAYVPDQPFLYDKLTGREFVNFTADMYEVPSALAASRLDGLVERLDMSQFLDQLTESYSHGMKQKIALAAALVHAPDVLVVDEPIVGLDPRSIRVIKDIFREIARAGGTVFMSTHTLDVVEAVADRIGILHRGRMVALGTLEQLKSSAGSMNRLEDIFLSITGASGPHAQATIDTGGSA
ncbi:MAG: ABC transporter ATP-binding protein [Phycisphaerae bacterium]